MIFKTIILQSCFPCYIDQMGLWEPSHPHLPPSPAPTGGFSWQSVPGAWPWRGKTVNPAELFPRYQETSLHQCVLMGVLFCFVSLPQWNKKSSPGPGSRHSSLGTQPGSQGLEVGSCLAKDRGALCAARKRAGPLGGSTVGPSWLRSVPSPFVRPHWARTRTAVQLLMMSCQNWSEDTIVMGGGCQRTLRGEIPPESPGKWH